MSNIRTPVRVEDVKIYGGDIPTISGVMEAGYWYDRFKVVDASNRTIATNIKDKSDADAIATALNTQSPDICFMEKCEQSKPIFCTRCGYIEEAHHGTGRASAGEPVCGQFTPAAQPAPVDDKQDEAKAFQKAWKDWSYENQFQTDRDKLLFHVGWNMASLHANSVHADLLSKVAKYEAALKIYADKDNWSHIDGWPQAFDKSLNGYEIAVAALEDSGIAEDRTNG